MKVNLTGRIKKTMVLVLAAAMLTGGAVPAAADEAPDAGKAQAASGEAAATDKSADAEVKTASNEADVQIDKDVTIENRESQTGSSIVPEETGETWQEAESHTYPGVTADAYEEGDNGLMGAGAGPVRRTQDGQRLPGIDVSQWQGTIDWNQVAASGVKFAIIKVAGRYYGNGGLYEDPYYAQNIEGALAAGLQVGVYFFSQALTEAEAREEASYICSRIRNYSITLPVYMDYEWSDGYRLANGGDKATRTAVIRAFCDAVTGYGYDAGVYWNAAHIGQYVDTASISRTYKSWLAYWPYADASAQQTYTDFSMGDRTPGNTFDGYYDMWQFTSSGQVPGISGRVDLDFWWTMGSEIDARRRTFLTGLYRYFLSRDPDNSGLVSWMTSLENGSTGVQTVLGFYNSTEFQHLSLSNEAYVRQMYQAIMNREADSGGLANWVNLLDNGVTREYVLQGFLNSTEFRNICNGMSVRAGTYTDRQIADRNTNITAFVARMYTIVLNRGFDRNGIDYWVTRIFAGAGGSSIARGFFNSREFINRNLSDGDFVRVAYRAILNREPDGAGYADWTGRLARGTSRNAILEGFYGSTEFARLCASYGMAR